MLGSQHYFSQFFFSQLLICVIIATSLSPRSIADTTLVKCSNYNSHVSSCENTFGCLEKIDYNVTRKMFQMKKEGKHWITIQTFSRTQLIKRSNKFEIENMMAVEDKIHQCLNG